MADGVARSRRGLSPPPSSRGRGGDAGGAEGAGRARSCRAPAEGLSPNQSAGPLRAGQSAPRDLGGGRASCAEPEPRAIGREGPKSFLLSANQSAVSPLGPRVRAGGQPALPRPANERAAARGAGREGEVAGSAKGRAEP